LGAVTLAHAQSDGNPFLPTPARSVSTIPTTGPADVNPYGVTIINSNFNHGNGPLRHKDILVSNYNGPSNLQGTGTSIVRIPAAGGPTSVFFRAHKSTGLSTALGTLQQGFVLVGSAPTLDGTSATAEAGSLLVLNNEGQKIQQFVSKDIQAPWDMTVVDNDTEERTHAAELAGHCLLFTSRRSCSSFRRTDRSCL
jgi:hypothetical protein